MFKRIVLAVDLNELGSAARAAETAVQLAEANGAELHVVNVVPDSGMAIVEASLGPEHSAAIREAARAAMTAWANETVPGIGAGQMHVETGTIYDRIIKAADRLEADVIVVGAHRPELRDYLVGPNAARVVRHANQSVFVVR